MKMSPRLIAISGSLQGTTFALTEEKTSIGRDVSNTIALNDPSVSREHCLISKNGGTDSFHIVDLESYNGTYVNGVAIGKQPLNHGDHVALGDIRFIFLIHDDAAPAVILQDDDLVSRSTIRLEREQSFYLQPERALSQSSLDSRAIRERDALIKISTTIISSKDSKELQRRLLELTFEAVPAERGAILLADEDCEDFVSSFGWNRYGADNSIKVSRTIAKQVLREVEARLDNDIVSNEDTSGLSSLLEAQVCSLLCVPLVASDKPLGVIYLDISSGVTHFDKGHLDLLTGIAGVAAIAVENVRRFELLEKENRRLHREGIKLDHEMLGESRSIREVKDLISKVAPSSSTVLLLGESGTGKELAARNIHLQSPRADKPFVAINCATLSKNLLESELFGHVKGAFTSAINHKQGKFEVADGGTIFLDEIGELSPALQAKLLRAVETREFERVGGTRSIKVDVRVIAATNRDLEARMKAGRFREDLYYRLDVVSILMPPLRDRREDIPQLAMRFVERFSKKCKRRVTGISSEADQLLCAYDWPGNVRELENAIERAVVMGRTKLIVPEDLSKSISGKKTIPDEPLVGYHEKVKAFKRRLISETLQKTRGNFTQAAKLLRIHANNLHRLVRDLNLREWIDNHAKD